MGDLEKIELGIINKIIIPSSFDKLYHKLWSKIKQSFGLSFHSTQLEYGFVRATPDPKALEYLKYRQFILSEKTKEKLIGDLRYQLLEGMKSSESIDEIKRRLDKIFEGNVVNTERIARTETLNAMAEGRFQANVQSGVANYKQWKAAMKNPRTAADSKRLNGQIQKIGDPFVDPKTGDTCMHNPNRPNCRCVVLYLRKLPLNIVMKDGLMYNANEVQKIELDIGSLSKAEKRIWIPPTAKRVGHYRKVKRAKKVEPEKKKEVWEKLSSDFISEEDTEAEPGSLVPTYTDFKDGDMRLDSLTGQIDILKSVKLDDLHYREKVSDIIDMDVVNQYVEWIKEGIMPPPITVIEDFRGRKETLNRRRVYAMRLAGIKSALAWQFYGNRRRIIKDAITSGKKVPLKVRKEVGVDTSEEE